MINRALEIKCVNDEDLNIRGSCLLSEANVGGGQPPIRQIRRIARLSSERILVLLWSKAQETFAAKVAKDHFQASQFAPLCCQSGKRKLVGHFPAPFNLKLC